MVELNQQQQKAADFLYGTAVVIAVPGSGKTLTMTHRICNLVKQHAIAPESILGLTFTKNAAKAMKDRLGPLLDDLAKRVMLNTIHSFCFHVLKREGTKFDLLCGRHQYRFLQQILRDLGLSNLSLGMVMREISLAKNNMVSSSDFRVLYEGDKTMQQVADVVEEYESRKAKKLMFDFDDLLLEVCNLLHIDETIRDKYRSSFQHLLVDEFQDTNPAQMEVVRLLLPEKPNGSSLWVCGDDWQSIYAFNGASVGNLLNFQDNFPDCDFYVLNENYRSTPEILKACQNLIDHNVRKIEKTLTTQNPPGEEIVVLECTSEEDEAFQVCRELQYLVSESEYDYKDIAVLYRANFQSRLIEECFSQQKVPYLIENGLNFYQRREVKWLMEYLRVIHNPDCDEALEEIINIPNRYLGKRFLEDLRAYAVEEGLHLYSALKTFPTNRPYVRHNIVEFLRIVDPLIENAPTLGPVQIIQMLRQVLDYDEYVSEDDVPQPDDVKIENLNQLELSAAKFDDLQSFLEYAETFEDTPTGDDKDGVRLMTIHKAKGLEFPVVFVIGLVEGILPSKKGDLEEERRICFVGISRAMQRLYLSHSHMYLGQPSAKSIFLDEIRQA